MKNLTVIALRVADVAVVALVRLYLALCSTSGIVCTFAVVSGAVLTLSFRDAVAGALVAVGATWAVTTAVLLVVLRHHVFAPLRPAHPPTAELPPRAQPVPEDDSDAIYPTAVILPARPEDTPRAGQFYYSPPAYTRR